MVDENKRLRTVAPRILGISGRTPTQSTPVTPSRTGLNAAHLLRSASVPPSGVNSQLPHASNGEDGASRAVVVRGTTHSKWREAATMRHSW
jgi:hypothetical protein